MNKPNARVTILNVDDDEAKRYIVSRILSKAGFDVREASTGGQALTTAFHSRPDLVVLDVNLPDIHGFEVCRQLKADARTSSIPVLHVSATAREVDDRVKGLEGGADGYLTEDVQADELVATVRALLRTKRAEEAARTLAVQWQTTFDAIDRGIVILDGASNVVRCNASFARWVNRSPRDLEGCPLSQVPILQDQLPDSDEWLVDGKWYQCSTQDISADSSDAGQTVLVISDVTDRNRTIEALRATEKRLDLAQQAGRIGAFDWDMTTGRHIWNETLERLYGLEPGGFAGNYEDWAKRIHPEDLPGAASALAQAMEHKKPDEEFEFRVVRPDGSLRWMNARARFEYDAAGKPVRMVGINMDITERKALDERMRESLKLESVGLLASGIAHDFNNLLVGVLGSASLLLDDLPEDYALRPVVENIALAGERASDLTRQLLAYAGKGHFFLEMIDLSEVVSETTALTHSAIPKDVDLYLELTRDLPKIKADRSQIQQIVMNLVLNAAEAFPDRKGRITISTRIFDPRAESTALRCGSGDTTPPLCLMLEVADNGIGMDEATKAKIFDPFFTTKFLGRGLGLAAVQGIVRAHKGSIGVETSPGQGTRFTLLLPVAEKCAAPPETKARVTGGAIKGVILLVDDESVVRSTSKAILERRGHTVLLARDGREGVEIFRENKDRISLVVLDLTMPVMNGDEALEELRRIDPNVRVILSSGFSEEQLVRQFEGRNVTGFIQKPYHMARLAEEVNRALESGSARRQGN